MNINILTFANLVSEFTLSSQNPVCVSRSCTIIKVQSLCQLNAFCDIVHLSSFKTKALYVQIVSTGNVFGDIDNSKQQAEYWTIESYLSTCFGNAVKSDILRTTDVVNLAIRLLVFQHLHECRSQVLQGHSKSVEVQK